MSAKKAVLDSRCLPCTSMCALVLLTMSVLNGCSEAAPPTARFQALPVEGPAPLSVQFTDESSPGSRGIAERRWDFGDKTTSSETDPIHVYHDPGSYSVALVVEGKGGQDEWTYKDLIRVAGSTEEASSSGPIDVNDQRGSSVAPEKGEAPSGTRAYYVAPGGSDTNDGSMDHPWLTLQHAAESLGAGDTLNIAAGAYEGDVDFSKSGTAEAPINVRGKSRESTVLNGHVQLSQGVSHFGLASMTVQGFRIWGVTLLGDNHHVHLRDLKVIGGEVGFRFTDGNSGDPPAEGPVSDVVLENCEVDGPTGPAVDCTPGPCDRMVFRNLDLHGAGLQGEASFGADGIGLERGKDVLVEDCYVHDNGGDGIDLNSRDYGGNAEEIVVRRNRVVRNHLMGIKLWAGGRMENNVVWGQGLTPVVVGKYPGTYEVVNNSIAFNMYADFSERDYSLVAGYPNDDTGIPPEITLTMVNNIIAFNTGPNIGDGPTGIFLGPKVRLTAGHNLFFSREDGEIQAEFVSRTEKVFSRAEILDGTWAKASGQGAGDIAMDPQFTAPWPNVDLRLSAGSPAADAGADALVPPTDIAGTARPQGAAPSIGAYER